MTQWVRGFVIPDVADVHASFQKCMADADRLVLLEREAGRRPADMMGPALLADLRLAYRHFTEGLQQAAEKGAAGATKGMKERLKGTQRRPSSGTAPPLEDLLEAAPIRVGNHESGAVGVANVELLNRAVNPHSRGYGPYWRALEYGTGQGDVPSQVGRILYGSFTGPGGASPTPPAAEYAGGGGPHPVFVSHRAGEPTSLGGERVVGLGTIGKEIEAKRFIRFGADAASVKWRSDIAAVQVRALRELREIRLARS